MASPVEVGERSVPDLLLDGGFTEVTSREFPSSYRHFVRVRRGSPVYGDGPDIAIGGVRYAQRGMELPPIPDVDVVEVEETPPRMEVRWTRYRRGGPETEIALFRIDGEPWDREAASMKHRLLGYAESMP